MRDIQKSKGKIFIVGIGPGSEEMMTRRAVEIIEQVDYLVGYYGYLKYVQHIFLRSDGHRDGHADGRAAHIVGSGMTKEVERARRALELAGCEGQQVALISSGDAGIYGMASLVLELLHGPGGRNFNSNFNLDLEIIPGVTASLAASSLLGAPLGHDNCTISLSNLLLPWETILKRLELALQADFVITLYNPASSQRKNQFKEVINLIRVYRSLQTILAVVRNAYREGEEIHLMELGELVELLATSVFPDYIDMHSVIIIGSSTSVKISLDGKNYMLTPRGYSSKYQVGSV
ncbi:MAG: precorrin-3B C(17)-methyltransferase [Oligoflexia bacterium]|nr:precorrin-3B C(17)-methyltransferase [Oligoflexia bacterium]